MIDQIFEGLVALKPGTTERHPVARRELGADADGHAGRSTCARESSSTTARRSTPTPSASTSTAGSTSRARSRTRAPRTTGRRLRRASRTRPEERRARGQPLQELRGRRRRTPSAEPDEAVGDVLSTLTLPSFSIASPTALQGVRSRRGHGRRGRRLPPDGHVRDRASDRAPARSSSSRGRSASSSSLVPQRRLLGRQGQARQDHLPADRRQRRAPAGAADRRDPGLRPRRAAGHPDDQGRLEPPAPRPPGVQRRLRRLSTRRRRRWTSSRCARRSRTASTARRSSTASTPAAAWWRSEFMPPELFGYADDVTKYHYDPEKSKQLLQHAGLTLPVKIDFWYPTDVSRPYMPDPKRNFEAFAASLEKSGFKVIAAQRSVEAGLRRQRQRGQGRRPEPDRLDRRLRRPRQLRRHVLPDADRTQFGLRRTPEIFNTPRRGRDRDRPGEARASCTRRRTADHELPAGRAVRAHASPRSRSRRTSRATSRARSSTRVVRDRHRSRAVGRREPAEAGGRLDAPLRRPPAAASRPDPARALDPRLLLDPGPAGRARPTSLLGERATPERDRADRASSTGSTSRSTCSTGRT